MRPPFVTSRPSWSAVPAWKTSAPVASAASTPSIGVPWSPRSGYSPPESTTVTAARSATSGCRREVAGEQRQQVALEAGQQRLRLGIAEAAVELDHAQPVLRSHQSRVEEPLERRAALRELAEHRQVHRLEDLAPPRRPRRRAAARRSPCRPCSGRCRRPRSACSRGRAGRRPRPRRRRARRRDSSGPSRSSSTWKGRSDACAASSAESSSSWVRQTQTPLPAASPSSLRTHGGRATGSVRAVGTPAASITSFAKDFEPSIRAAAALGPKTAMPRWRSSSARPGDQGRLGADDDEVDPELAGERDERGVVVRAHGMAVGERGDSRVAGSGMQLVEVAAAGERPGERVLATSRPDDERPHPRIV